MSITKPKKTKKKKKEKKRERNLSISLLIRECRCTIAQILTCMPLEFDASVKILVISS